MAYVIACSKIWDPKLTEKLSSAFPGKFHLITAKEELNLERLQSWGAKKVFFPHWSHLIKPEIFESFECIIFHMTDLPYGRGGSPLQNLIALGHRETKISALRCSQGMDTGPIYLKRGLSLEGSAQEIFIRASVTIQEMILEILRSNPTPVEQSGEVVEFKRRRPEDGDLSQLHSLEKVYDYIRMLDAEGYPRAFVVAGQFKYEFEAAAVGSDGELSAKVRIKRL